MAVHTLIVAANTHERMMGAHHVSSRLDSLGIPHSMYVDCELKGASQAWLSALDEVLPTIEPLDYLCILPDDAELSDSFSSHAFASLLGERGNMFGDLQANHPGAHIALEGGYGWYTSPDGFTAFGGTARAFHWKSFAEWYRKRAPQLKFDEAVNVYAQLNKSQILKPAMSKVEHRLEFKSLEGNDYQNSEPIVRRSAHFDPKAPWGSDEVVHMGRSYKANHWRFLWLLTPEQRRQTQYVRAAYRVHRDLPPKTISPASSMEKATPLEMEAAR